MKAARILLLFFFVSLYSFSQEKRVVDSLMLLIAKAPPDTMLVQYYNSLAGEYLGNDPAKVKNYTDKALELAVKIGYRKGEALAWSTQGICYKNQGIYEPAKQCHQKALAIFRELKNNYAASTCINNLGIVEKELGNYEAALKLYIEALALLDEKKKKDRTMIARVYSNIGIVYKYLKNYDKALEYYESALKINKDLNDQMGISRVLSNLGGVYNYRGEHDKAIEMYLEALKIREGTNDKEGMAVGYANLGGAYTDKGDYEKALDYYKRSLDIYSVTGDKDGTGECTQHVGEVLVKMKKPALAVDYFKSAISIAREIGDRMQELETSHSLYEVYTAMNRPEDAVKCLERYAILRDSLFNTNMNKQMSEMEQKYQGEKKQREIELLQKNQSISDLEVKRQRMVIYGGALISLLVLVFALISYRNFREKKKANSMLESQNSEIQHQKNIIEEKNKDILDSIRYAKRLQDAILPSPKLVQELLPDSFIYFKPKDIVSGDFYWMEKNGDDVLFAAVDCTGHGVPGAIMSMVSHNILNAVVREKKINEPAAMLNEVLKDLMIALRQKQDEATANDGMDISLCRLNRKRMQLSYAGAGNPLWIIRNGELMETKATKFSVGRQAYESGVTYEGHNIDLQKEDRIYLFSDGYADQFGGDKGKKMMRKNFNQLLVQSASLPMNEQMDVLDREFRKWKGDYEQVDDILIIGVRV